METIGLIGGMSWYSTAEYYKVINQAVQQARGGHHSAPITLQSVDFDEIRDCQVSGDWDRAGAALARMATKDIDDAEMRIAVLSSCAAASKARPTPRCATRKRRRKTSSRSRAVFTDVSPR